MTPRPNDSDAIALMQAAGGTDDSLPTTLVIAVLAAAIIAGSALGWAIAGIMATRQSRD